MCWNDLNEFCNLSNYLFKSMNNSAIHSNKQRGIYSEMIIPDNSVTYQNGLVGGPD